MRKLILWMAALMIAATVLPSMSMHAQAKEETPASKTDLAKPEQFKSEQQAVKARPRLEGP